MRWIDPRTEHKTKDCGKRVQKPIRKPIPWFLRRTAHGR